MRKGARNLMVLGVIFVMLVGLALSAYLIVVNVEENARLRAERVLLDSAEEQSGTFLAILNGQVEALGLVASRLEEITLDKAAVTSALESMSGLCSSESLAFFTPGDVVYASADDDLTEVGRYCVETALAGSVAVQKTYARADGESVLFIAVPCVRDGHVVGAVRGAYDENVISATLDSRAYSGEGSSLVVDSGGDIIIRPETESFLSDYSNIMNFLAKAVFMDGYSRVETLDCLENGRRGTIRFKHSGNEFIASFAPVRDDKVEGMDWFMFNIVSSDTISSEVESGMAQAMLSMIVFVVCCLSALGVFFLFEGYTRRRLISDSNIARVREERYRLVVAESGREVFQYDVKTKSVHRDNILYDYFGSVNDIKDWPGYIISSQIADEENRRLLLDMFAKVDEGETPLTFDVNLIHPDGSRDWNRFHINTIFDDDKKPVTAVVSYFNCTYLHESESAYLKWLDEAKRLDKEFAARFYWNITLDVMEEAQYESNPRLAYEGGGMSEWADKYANAYVAKEDRSAYLAFFATDRMLGAFEHGSENETLDYRETCDGTVKWLRLTAGLTRHPQTGDVKARLLYQDIDDVKRKEMEILAKSELDSLTGAYNRETLIKKVATLIEDSPSSTHAFLMMDVDGFKAVNDILGHDEGDMLLKEIIGIIKSCLRADDIVGRIGGDEMMVVLKDIPADTVIRKKARQLCDMLSIRVKDKVEISVSIGIALYPRDASGYDELYKRADTAMYKAKANGKNGYFFYNQLALESGARPGSPDDDEQERPLQHANDRRVVYVGDDDENAEIVRRALCATHDVIVTDNQRRAVVSMRFTGTTKCFAVVDFKSTESTAEAIAACRAGSDAPRAPIIAVVDERDDYAIERVMASGASDFITRPFDESQINARIEAAAIRVRGELRHYNAKYQDFQREEEENYSLMMMATNTAMVIHDWSNGLFIYNPSVERTLAGTYDKRSFWRILLVDMVARSTDVKQMQALVMRLANNPGVTRDEMNVVLKTSGGERHCFRFQAIKMDKTDFSSMRIVLVLTDINDSVEKSDKLVFRAERDSLTGLYNADTFFERASVMIRQKPEGYYTMLAIDMDNFKSINNQFGRIEGNRILNSLARRMSRSAHATSGIVSRIFADNFAVLCTTDGIASFDDVLGDCLRGIERYQDFFATALHAGRYLVSDKSMSVNDMYDRAVIAKASIKYRYDVHVADFSEGMLEKLISEQSIVNVMESALEEGQFEVWYQPQYDTTTLTIASAEALVRWRRPNHGVVPPGEYVPLFESNGFIYKLDQFVWNSVAKSLSERVAAGKNVVPVSVNVSRFDIYQPDFYEVITAIPARYSLDVDLLRLEITESAFVGLPNKIHDMIVKLREFGFEIYVDDFGGGNFSVTTLKEVAADAIKLDSGLMHGVGTQPIADKIVEGVISMAQLLNMPVIAKGVEYPGQIEYLKSIGCGFVQGYVYCLPMPMNEFAKLLDDDD